MRLEMRFEKNWNNLSSVTPKSRTEEVGGANEVGDEI